MSHRRAKRIRKQLKYMKEWGVPIEMETTYLSENQSIVLNYNCFRAWAKRAKKRRKLAL